MRISGRSYNVSMDVTRHPARTARHAPRRAGRRTTRPAICLVSAVFAATLVVLGPASPASANILPATAGLVSRDAAGEPAGGASTDPSLSGNARFVAFTSEGTALVPGDTNNASDIFVKDRWSQSIERVSAEMAASARSLQESETRLRRILESAKDAIVTFDDDHRIVMFNGTASVMFACPPAQAVGMRVTEFMPQRVRAQHHLNVERFRVVGEAFGYNVGLRRSGQEFPVEVSYSNVVEGQGVLHTMIIRDITARKANLDALKRSNQDLQQFAFVASHDLKTPLRSISGFVQMLDRKYADRLDDEARSLISRTQNATVRLEQLTDDLLAYAQVNHNPAPFVRVELQSVMQEVMQLQHVALLETGAQLTVGVLPAVMGERTQLIQLFSNLLANSLKYCQNLPPTVHITATPGANFWTVHVQDNGIGIEEKHFAKIFDVFKRLHTQQEYAGTGIGLALCKRVAEHHGGSISVTSAPGAGSTFDVSFPKVPESLNTEERAA